MAARRLVLVAGTHALRDFEALEKLADRGPVVALPWWHPRSAFANAARAHGLTLVDDARPFIWSTDLDGVLGENTTWHASGWALIYYAAAHGVDELDVLAHSHGAEVAVFAACYAATYGVRVRRLLTVCAPVRRDMQRFRRRARGSVDDWIAVASDGDWWKPAGQLMDGQVGDAPKMPEANNLVIPGYGHTGLLDDPTAFEREGLWPLLRAA